ncbi:hypothetical protein SUGI_0950760 [Cryptomeria japonica]|nr:hypothetical protein SUGI_0950760 [Cryptomeria japonica]
MPVWCALDCCCPASAGSSEGVFSKEDDNKGNQIQFFIISTYLLLIGLLAVPLLDCSAIVDECISSKEIKPIY